MTEAAHAAANIFGVALRRVPRQVLPPELVEDAIVLMPEEVVESSTPAADAFMLPPEEEDFIRTWLWDHRDATYPVIK